MPEKKTIERAKRDKREGKSPSTQAGEFVREEMEHVRRGKHGSKSRKQTVAIGLSKARQAGVDLPGPEERTGSARKKAATKKGSAKKSPAKKSPTKKTATKKSAAKKSAPKKGSQKGRTAKVRSSTSKSSSAQKKS